MRPGEALADLIGEERQLAGVLQGLSERQSAEHDVFHVGRSQATATEQRVEQLGPHAQRYGVILPKPSPPPAAPPERPLLDDLRIAYLQAQSNELAWIVLIQTALVARDAALLDTANECHERAVACAAWLRTRIKETVPTA